MATFTSTVDPVEFLDYASSVAWNKMRRSGLGGEMFEDVQQDAHEAVVKAARRFDPDRGVPFTAFAVRSIQGAVVDGMRRRTWWTYNAAAQGAQQPVHLIDGEYEAFIAALRCGFEEALVEEIAHEQRLAWIAGHADLLTSKQRATLTEILAGAPTHLVVAQRLGISEAGICHSVGHIVKRLRPHARNECARCPSQFHASAQAA